MCPTFIIALQFPMKNLKCQEDITLGSKHCFPSMTKESIGYLSAVVL